MSVTIVVPVKDGARWLPELLAALDRQEIDSEVEILVVDSGSADGSATIARKHGARLIEISPADFGHGRTRNLAAERSSGEVIVFLTHDAVPEGDRWLAELVRPLDASARVGMSFGPHLPRSGTSPMIARELVEFFAGFSPRGETRIDEAIDDAPPRSGFFSNVNSAVLRTCWEEVRFRDVPYSEDQAFARDAMAAGWRKAYAPRAAVVHAHDYPFTRFMRRYFDEYRGLREAAGHVATVRPRAIVRDVVRQVRSDIRYIRAQERSPQDRLAWSARSLRHHGGRALFAALGSRADRLPPALVRRLSLEGTAAPATRSPARIRRPPERPPYRYVRSYLTAPQAPLAAPSPHDADREHLHFAWVIPPYRRGSGGHMTIFTIARLLEERGHSCSIWVHDPGRTSAGIAAVAHRELVEHFAPLRAGVFDDFSDWHGADVAFATGWQTAYPLWQLGDCKLKAYFVQDYEPDFYGASAERLWAERTYEMGYPCVAASRWLAELLRDRYGARADEFELGVDLDTYRSRDVPRRDDTVVFYARPSTPRRATDMGFLALDELVRRRPGTRVVVFGDTKKPPVPFRHDFRGVMDADSLADLYNEATAGLVISLTNYSRMPKEMMACGLPVVDVRHPSVVSAFGGDEQVIELADVDFMSIADRLDALLDDPARRGDLATRARHFVSGMTWDAATDQIEGSVRRWLVEGWEAVRSGAQSRSASVEAARR